MGIKPAGYCRMANRCSHGPSCFANGDRANILRALSRTTQRAIQSSTLFEAQGFSASCRLYLRFRQSPPQLALRIFQLQIIPQRLAFLAERKPQEVYESIAHDPQLLR